MAARLNLHAIEAERLRSELKQSRIELERLRGAIAEWAWRHDSQPVHCPSCLVLLAHHTGTR